MRNEDYDGTEDYNDPIHAHREFQIRGHINTSELFDPRSVAVRMRVQCLECGKKFATRSQDPKCPSCDGHDVELQ